MTFISGISTVPGESFEFIIQYCKQERAYGGGGGGKKVSQNPRASKGCGEGNGTFFQRVTLMSNTIVEIRNSHTYPI